VAVYYSSTSSALFLDPHEGSLIVPGDECFHKFRHKASVVTYECPWQIPNKRFSRSNKTRTRSY